MNKKGTSKGNASFLKRNRCSQSNNIFKKNPSDVYF